MKKNITPVEIQGSSIKARRNSDGRTVRRDASKFKRFFPHNDVHRRERLLRYSKRKQQTPDRERETGARNHQELYEADGTQEENDHQDGDAEDEAARNLPSTMPQRRELPKRKRQLSSKFKD